MIRPTPKSGRNAMPSCIIVSLLRALFSLVVLSSCIYRSLCQNFTNALQLSDYLRLANSISNKGLLGSGKTESLQKSLLNGIEEVGQKPFRHIENSPEVLSKNGSIESTESMLLQKIKILTDKVLRQSDRSNLLKLDSMVTSRKFLTHSNTFCLPFVFNLSHFLMLQPA
jgi:hypothetical protein